MKTLVVAVAFNALASWPALAVSFIDAVARGVQLQCSSYQKDADGRWTVIRPDTVINQAVGITVQVAPGSDVKMVHVHEMVTLDQVLSVKCVGR